MTCSIREDEQQQLQSEWIQEGIKGGSWARNQDGCLQQESRLAEAVLTAAIPGPACRTQLLSLHSLETTESEIEKQINIF